MRIPTIWVVRLADGHEMTINEADFDAELYRMAGGQSPQGDPEPIPADEGVEQEQEGVEDVVVMSAAEIVALGAPDVIEVVQGADEAGLDAIEAAEGQGKNRKGVKAAIRARRKELSE